MMNSLLHRIRVFVASPSDVKAEREALESVIEQLNKVWGPKKAVVLELLDWREHIIPWLEKSPEQTLLEQLPISSWDLFVGIIWSRFGTPTGDRHPRTGQPFRSGTEQEFVLAYESSCKFGKPRILMYRCKRSIRPDELDADQWRLVQEFFGEFERGGEYFGLYTPYESIEEFADYVRRHLLSALIDFETDKISSPPWTEAPEGGLTQWLSAVGLSGNPFSRREADADDNLPKYFHLFIPYFDELLGIGSESSRTAVIFGEKGVGKSALRKMMVHYSLRLPGGRSAFAIPYTDFSVLAEKAQSGKRVTPRDHVEEIIKTSVRSLAQAIQDDEARPSPRATEDELFELWRYVSHFKSYLSRSQLRLLSDLLKADSNSYTDDMALPESYPELFYGFCGAVRVLEYDTVWVLVDRIDENILTAENADLVLQIIKPLLADLQLMTPPKDLATFRFFLNTAFRNSLKAESTVRLKDRHASYILEWEREDLLALIEKRLKAFSSPGRKPYTRLGELSDINNLDKILVARSNGNPRNLIMLCEFVISEHCRLPISDDNLMLTREDLDRALERFEETTSDESIAASPLFSPVELLPTPLAVIIARYTSDQQPIRKLNYAYYLTQCVLQFVGCCMSALYWHSEGRDPSLDQRLRELIGTAGRPPTLGRWQELVNRIAGSDLVSAIPLMNTFADFAKSSNVRAHLGKLIQMRNAFAHGRTGIDDHRTLQQLREVDGSLEEVLDALEPLGALTLLTIEGYDVDEHRQFIHRAQVHRGNIQVPRRKQIRTDDAHFRRGEVLLYDEETESTCLLSPFIVFEPHPSPDGVVQSRELWLFDQVVDPRHKHQLAVKYVNFVSSSTASFDKYLDELQQLGFITIARADED